MRQQVTIDEIKDGLIARIDAVVHQLAPPAQGSHTTRGRYFTLNPGRADRKVGSFCITMTGPKAGRWNDYASGEKGDVIDLVAMSLNLDAAGAIKWARAFLGLDTESPEDRRRREEAAARLKRQREDQARRQVEADRKRRKVAEGIWLSAREDLTGTPVDLYLQGRGIDLRALPWPPRAIRYHAECRYYWTEDVVDQSTGEVRQVQRHRPLPAMVTAIARGGEIIDCHRTYLTIGADGRWTKAPVPDAKKVLTDYTGGSIRLCGELGPRGGMRKLKDAQAGSRVYVAEGIENALSLMMIRALRGQPPAFVVAAGSVWNMGNVELPDSVAEVVLAADNDEAEAARDMLDQAVAFHQGKGRAVRVWRSETPGEDLNDALQRVLAARDAEQGAA